MSLLRGAILNIDKSQKGLRVNNHFFIGFFDKSQKGLRVINQYGPGKLLQY